MMLREMDVWIKIKLSYAVFFHENHISECIAQGNYRKAFRARYLNQEIVSSRYEISVENCF